MHAEVIGPSSTMQVSRAVSSPLSTLPNSLMLLTTGQANAGLASGSSSFTSEPTGRAFVSDAVSRTARGILMCHNILKLCSFHAIKESKQITGSNCFFQYEILV